LSHKKYSTKWREIMNKKENERDEKTAKAIIGMVNPDAWEMVKEKLEKGERTFKDIIDVLNPGPRAVFKEQIKKDERKIKKFIDVIKPDDWVTVIDRETILKRHSNGFKRLEYDQSDLLYLNIFACPQRPRRNRLAILNGSIKEFDGYSTAELIIYPKSSPKGPDWSVEVLALLAKISVDHREMIEKRSNRLLPNQEKLRALRALMHGWVVETMEAKARKGGFKPFTNPINKGLFDISPSGLVKQRLLSDN
jgi:hypothetical protein